MPYDVDGKYREPFDTWGLARLTRSDETRGFTFGEAAIVEARRSSDVEFLKAANQNLNARIQSLDTELRAMRRALAEAEQDVDEARLQLEQFRLAHGFTEVPISVDVGPLLIELP